MPVLAVALVLFTTIANAAALVLQRKAAQDVAASRGGSPGRLLDVARRPAWLAGITVFVVAVTSQVTALTIGSIALVQPVLVMGLPFTLLLGGLVLGGALRREEWLAVATMSVGLVVLLVSLRPEGGNALATPTRVWVVGSVVTLALLAGLCLLASRSDSAVVRAGLFGAAAGFGSGFVAVIVKAMSEALVLGGLGEVVATWQSYLLVPAAPLAFLALQWSLRAGQLIVSQPGLVLGNPLLASSWGVGLLGESVRGGVALLGGLVGAALVVTGVVRLSRSPLLAAQEAGHAPAEPAGDAVA